VNRAHIDNFERARSGSNLASCLDGMRDVFACAVVNSPAEAIDAPASGH
jgi:hypothetical protein